MPGHGLRMKAKGGAAIGELLRQQKATAAKQGMTVDQLIEKRIEFMKVMETKDDGEKRPRIESWENVARHLRNLVSPRLGKLIAKEVTKGDIAALSNDIVDGKHGGKASVSNARHMRRAAFAMFAWAAEAGLEYISESPCREPAEAKAGAAENARANLARSGFYGMASTATTFHGTAPRGSRSSSRLPPCCSLTNCCRSTAVS
jgi:hypothetical protein